jgi:hypothetical protein
VPIWTNYPTPFRLVRLQEGIIAKKLSRQAFRRRLKKLSMVRADNIEKAKKLPQQEWELSIEVRSVIKDKGA